MDDYTQCPNCGSHNTRSVFTNDIAVDEIERVMLCDNCRCQYVAKFRLYACDVDENPTEANADRTSE